MIQTLCVLIGTVESTNWIEITAHNNIHQIRNITLTTYPDKLNQVSINIIQGQ